MQHAASIDIHAIPLGDGKLSTSPKVGYVYSCVTSFNGGGAGAHEIQDSCDGHPQEAGIYHYHTPSPCIPGATKPETVVGYALDGFPITSMYGSGGTQYTDDDLDACHGMTSTITFPDGTSARTYHYVLTQEYPYTLGCFMGTPVRAAANGGQGTQGSGAPAGAGAPQTQTQGGEPPQAAINACANAAQGSTCSFATPNGTVSGSCRTTPAGESACVPN